MRLAGAARTRPRCRATSALAGLLTLAVALGCAVSPQTPPGVLPQPEGPGDFRELDARALLLLMGDQRLFDPFSVDTVRREAPEAWPHLALTLGRIGDPRGRPVLEGLLAADSVETRRAAAFGLGLLAAPASRRALEGSLADADPETGRLSIEALARLEVPLVEVLSAAEALSEDEFWGRLLPNLFRFPLESTLAVIEPLLSRAIEDLDPGVVYGVGRSVVTQEPAAGLVEPSKRVLRLFLKHPDPWARGWAARGLGAIGTGADLDLLLPMLEGPDSGPVIQSLRAASAMIAAGRAADTTRWRSRVLLLLESPHPGVRSTAIETAGRLLLDERLSAALVERVGGGRGWERRLALRALASGGDPAAAALVARLAVSPLAADRAAAAWCAGGLGLDPLLGQLGADPEPRVRLEALAARLGEGGSAPEDAARLALLDPDVAVRAAALEWLSTSPRAPFGELALAIQGNEARRLVEVRLAGVEALVARAVVEPLERGAIVAVLEILERDRDYLVRRAAGDALARLDRPRSEPEPVDTARGLRDYRELAGRLLAVRRVELSTRHGAVTLRLECDQAPLTCSSFLQLANQGFYDGLSFHRVVADFVVQGGDPRGDGWGGPGFTLRDEPNTLRFERGVLGMATSGPDTAGSQFFVALSRQPHLDGIYTAFGRVEGGDDILDRIVEGDTIERLAEVVIDGAGG